MSNLTTFSAELRKRFANAATTDIRPFVCDGNPLNACIFLVGYNARESSPRSFWDYWNDQKGFNKQRWLGDYRSARRARKEKLLLSRTRERIERITNAAKPCQVVETNIYSVASESKRSLRSASKGTAIFDWLLQTIGPAVIILHGVDAQRHLEGLCRKHKIEIDGRIVVILVLRHLVKVSFDHSVLAGTWARSICNPKLPDRPTVAPQALRSTHQFLVQTKCKRCKGDLDGLMSVIQFSNYYACACSHLVCYCRDCAKAMNQECPKCGNTLVFHKASDDRDILH